MKPLTIGTYNCENLFLRYKFGEPASGKKKGESDEAFAKRITAARVKALKQFEEEGLDINSLRRNLNEFSTISHLQRMATAKMIWDGQNSPDIIALVEVENMEALKKFNSSEFFGTNRYPYYMLIDGNDPRGIDVAVLSRYPIGNIRSHIWDTYVKKVKPSQTFSRDCLEVEVDVDGRTVTLFINHFKSQLMDNPDRRTRQTDAVARIVESRFGAHINDALFAIVGDFNQVPEDASLQPLLSKPWQEQIVARLPGKERWTYAYDKSKNKVEVSQLDYILLSKPLASHVVKGPWIDRRGLAKYPGLEPYYPAAERRILTSVDGPKTEASDHCPVFVQVSL